VYFAVDHLISAPSPNYILHKQKLFSKHHTYNQTLKKILHTSKKQLMIHDCIVSTIHQDAHKFLLQGIACESIGWMMELYTEGER